MNIRPLLPVVMLAAGFVALPVLASAQNGESLTVPFSDPSRPGMLEVSVMSGSITVKGSNRKDVQINTRQRGESGRGDRGQRDGAPAGLRRLTQSGGFDVEESGNTMEVSAGPFGRSIDFEILVPTRTNLELSLVNGNAIIVEAVEGDIEVNNINGSITLTNVAGSVVANANNGKVTATLTRAATDKPMSFTSLNGQVDVTLPASIKANFKLRSDQGDVYTDFDLQVRPQPSETKNQTNRGFKIEINRSIYGSVNGGGPEIEMRSFNGNVFVRKGQ